MKKIVLTGCQEALLSAISLFFPLYLFLLTVKYGPNFCWGKRRFEYLYKI
jgi:hypothetical protein